MTRTLPVIDHCGQFCPALCHGSLSCQQQAVGNEERVMTTSQWWLGKSLVPSTLLSKELKEIDVHTFCHFDWKTVFI